MSWAQEVTLAELAEGGLFSDGDWVESKDQDASGDVRLTQLADVGVGEFRDRSDRWMRRDQAHRLRCTFLEGDDVLIARMPDPIGRSCLVPSSVGSAVTVVDVAILRLARRDANPRYVMWALNSPRFHSKVVALQSGTTRKRISRKNLASLTIPLPTLDEQNRIVDLLEDHLSRLDAAESSLRLAMQKADAMTTASLDRQTTAGSRAWRDTAIGAMAELVEYGSSAKCAGQAADSDVPVLRMGNIQNGKINWTGLKYLPAGHEEFPKLLLQSGDLVFNRTNSAELVGKSAVFEDTRAASFASYLIRVRFGQEVNPAWANMVINSPAGRRYVKSVASQQVGQANVNGTKLKAFPLPLPPLDEQCRRVRAHDEVVVSRERLHHQIADLVVRAAGLRRALLAAAFTGRLTNSAEGLLEELESV